MAMKKRILVVEDFKSIRDYLCQFLGTQGYQTLAATDGQHALEILEIEKVDLIISDFNMPKVNGMELLNEIKKSPAFSNIPVIFLTTEKSLDKMKEAREAGLFAWIKKPYNAPTFLANIDRALANERVSS